MMKTEYTPLKDAGDLERPQNWKQAESGSWPTPSYESDEIRKQCQRGFLRKVYGILSVQLATTMAVCWVVMAHPPLNNWVNNNHWMLIVCFLASFALIFALQWKKNSYPANGWLLAAFTVVESFTVATACARFEAHGVGYLVAVAWGVTLTVFACLTLLVTCSAIDFSFMGMFLPAGLVCLLIFGLASALFGFHLGYAFAAAGALLFSGFIVYDTYMIMNRLGTDDYIIASVELYLDLINLFLMILDLLGGGRR